MKRIATFMLLLVVLAFAGSISAQAQRISPQENARRSRKADQEAAKDVEQGKQETAESNEESCEKATEGDQEGEPSLKRVAFRVPVPASDSRGQSPERARPSPSETFPDSSQIHSDGPHSRPIPDALR